MSLVLACWRIDMRVTAETASGLLHRRDAVAVPSPPQTCDHPVSQQDRKMATPDSPIRRHAAHAPEVIALMLTNVRSGSGATVR